MASWTQHAALPTECCECSAASGEAKPICTPQQSSVGGCAIPSHRNQVQFPTFSRRDMAHFNVHLNGGVALGVPRHDLLELCCFLVCCSDAAALVAAGQEWAGARCMSACAQDPCGFRPCGVLLRSGDTNANYNTTHFGCMLPSLLLPPLHWCPACLHSLSCLAATSFPEWRMKVPGPCVRSAVLLPAATLTVRRQPTQPSLCQRCRPCGSAQAWRIWTLPSHAAGMAVTSQVSLNGLRPDMQPQWACSTVVQATAGLNVLLRGIFQIMGLLCVSIIRRPLPAALVPGHAKQPVACCIYPPASCPQRCCLLRC